VGFVGFHCLFGTKLESNFTEFEGARVLFSLGPEKIGHCQKDSFLDNLTWGMLNSRSPVFQNFQTADGWIRHEPFESFAWAGPIPILQLFMEGLTGNGTYADRRSRRAGSAAI
jgi:hypothetical protein